MTAADLQGRALDEAVAKAMGWTHSGKSWVAPVCKRDGSLRRIYAVDDYSTDFAALPEMIAFLKAQPHDGLSIEIGDRVQASIWRALPPRADEDCGDIACEDTDGATLPEAIARLVVAVAAVRAPEGKS